jgi:hypothetical protein
LLGFELPDMSFNRENDSTAEEARKGFRPDDWGVASVTVRDMAPRESVAHIAHSYRF